MPAREEKAVKAQGVRCMEPKGFLFLFFHQGAHVAAKAREWRRLNTRPHGGGRLEVVYLSVLSYGITSIN